MKEKSNTKRTTLWICLTAMFMALNVAMSSFGVPVPGGENEERIPFEVK